MEKVAFRVGNFEIMWYALIIMIGVVLGLIVANFNIKRRKDLNLSFDDLTDAFVWAFPLAIVGARAYYVFFEWANYKDNPMEILNLRGGGLAIHGGILGALIGVILYKLTAKKSWSYILDLADSAAPALVLAQAVGRWGNFINQEAYGSEVSRSFMQKFPKFIYDGMFIEGKFYHPTFLYESLWNILVFIILMVLFTRRKKEKKGSILAFYLILYSIGRFFIESLRTDSLYWGNFRVAQLVSILMIVLGLLMLLSMRNIKEGEKEELKVQDRNKEDNKSIENVGDDLKENTLEDKLKKASEKLELKNKTRDLEESEISNTEVLVKVNAEAISPLKEGLNKALNNKMTTGEEGHEVEATKLKDAILKGRVKEGLENKERQLKKGIVKAEGELVEPVTEKKMSLKDKLKASREKSKERVKSLDSDN